MGESRFAVVFVDREGRHEKDAALGHRIEQFGPLIQIAAVLDRIDAGLDRNLQSAAAQRVAHHPTI